jgi:uncharacterized protein (DUF2267 family)
MDELLAQVTQRTGLPPDQARQAVEVVLDFLKQRLPAPVAGHLDQFLGGGPPSGTQGSSGFGGIAQELGGLFNRGG